MCRWQGATGPAKWQPSEGGWMRVGLNKLYPELRKADWAHKNVVAADHVVGFESLILLLHIPEVMIEGIG